MTQQDYTHSITPPPELRSKWFNEAPGTDLYDYIIEQAAQWGADQELEACCETLDMVNGSNYWSQVLRSGHRPKPPSLKVQALQRLPLTLEETILYHDDISIIRRALEQLPDNQ